MKKATSFTLLFLMALHLNIIVPVSRPAAGIEECIHQKNGLLIAMAPMDREDHSHGGHEDHMDHQGHGDHKMSGQEERFCPHKETQAGVGLVNACPMGPRASGLYAPAALQPFLFHAPREESPLALDGEKTPVPPLSLPGEEREPLFRPPIFS